jgi:hypothetical protein
MTALACVSCGDGNKKVYPVEGKVLINGQPAKGAFVFLHPCAGKDFTKGDQPRGVAGEDGTFHIGTYKAADGAPLGLYTATDYWTPARPTGGDEGGYVPFVRYLSPQTSPLHIEVKNQPTVLEPFQLTFQ